MITRSLYNCITQRNFRLSHQSGLKAPSPSPSSSAHLKTAAWQRGSATPSQKADTQRKELTLKPPTWQKSACLPRLKSAKPASQNTAGKPVPWGWLQFESRRISFWTRGSEPSHIVILPHESLTTHHITQVKAPLECMNHCVNHLIWIDVYSMLPYKQIP